PVDPSAEVGVVVKPAFCSNGRRDGLSGAALPFTGKVHYAALVSGEKPWLSAISRRSTIPNPDWLRWALIYVHPQRLRTCKGACSRMLNPVAYLLPPVTRSLPERHYFDLVAATSEPIALRSAPGGATDRRSTTSFALLRSGIYRLAWRCACCAWCRPNGVMQPYWCALAQSSLYSRGEVWRIR